VRVRLRRRVTPETKPSAARFAAVAAIRSEQPEPASVRL
jgi:hypothetical protein